MRRLVPIVMALIATNPVAAWEIDGFRAGMTLAEAQASAARSRITLKPVQGMPGSFLVSRLGAEAHASIGFCKDQTILFSYSGFNVGGFDAFVRMVEREERRLGQGQYGVYSSETNQGALHQIKVSWRESFWIVEINALQLGAGRVGASRLVSGFAALC